MSSKLKSGNWLVRGPWVQVRKFVRRSQDKLYCDDEALAPKVPIYWLIDTRRTNLWANAESLREARLSRRSQRGSFWQKTIMRSFLWIYNWDSSFSFSCKTLWASGPSERRRSLSTETWWEQILEAAALWELAEPPYSSELPSYGSLRGPSGQLQSHLWLTHYLNI